jgi:hypothetical protein
MPKANLKDCKTAITDIAKDLLSDKEATSFIEALDQKIRNINEGSLVSVEEKIQQAGQQLAEEVKTVALINKRNALQALKASRKLKKSASSYESPSRGILAYLEDSARYAEAAGRGINAIIEGYKDKYIGALKSSLVKAGVFEEYTKDSLVKEIFQEFYSPGSSGSAKAKAIRDIMFALKQDAVRLQNLNGSFIGFLPEHVKRQVYNPLMIKKAFGPERFQKFMNLNRWLSKEEYDQTFKQWAEFMLPLLDHERTFKDEDPMKFLRGAFTGIMSGKHGPIQKASGAEINTAFFRAGALAKKASSQRLIHFKDADGAFQAYKLMSDEPLSKGFIVELEHAASNIGLMQQLGPNPRGTLEETVKQLEHEFSGDEAKLRDLQHNKHKIFSALSFLDRSANIPENPTLQTATATVISLLSQAKLGKLFFFALPDRALIQSVLTRNGMTGLDALATSLKLTRPNSADERLRLTMLGGELKSFINAVQTRFSTGSESGVPSLILNSQKHFFNFTGINWLDDVGTDAIMGALPRHIGAMADRPFDKLIPEMQTMFKMYDIKPSEWDAMRSTVYSVMSDATTKEGMHGTDIWITPDTFEKIPDSVIDSLLHENGVKVSDNNRARQRDLLESKYRTWLTAQKNEGVLMPGSKEHRMATFGTQSGTIPGSLARLIMMFKTFPITVYTKIMEREMYGDGARTFSDWVKAEKNRNFHTTQLIALTTIAGYLSLTIDELVQGKSPRKFTNDKGEIDAEYALPILRDSFLRGNSASLLGDLMLREYDTGYKNILSQLGGPAVNEFVRTTALLSKSVRGETSAQDYVDFTKRNIPWANLFYVKPALDHLIWFNIQEMLDPGSLREMEQNQKEKFNQEFWMKPSEVNEEITE